MQETKIVFSEEELHLLNDSSFWKHKRSLTSKLYELLGHCTTLLKNEHEELFKKSLHHEQPINARISKGENYLGRPYVILDYPNVFARDKVFAIRTMFWYGELLSCSLVIGGEPLENYSEKILARLGSAGSDDIYFNIADDPWQHHFDETNVKEISEITIDEMRSYIRDKNFIKLSIKISPANPTEWEEFILYSYRLFINLVS